jgi:hypothetical protein
VRRSHEQWFHFVKQPRYYSAIDEVREEHSPHTMRYYGAGVRTEPRQGKNDLRRNEGGWHADPAGTGLNAVNPLGKLPGSVWSIPSQPLTVPAHLGVDHFAAFPCEWPRRIILGWSPGGICVECGEGRRPVADGSEKYLHRPGAAALIGKAWKTDSGDGRAKHDLGNVRTVHRVTGYDCACPDTLAPTRPSVVLDPFGGTGTTALVASALGRIGVSVDLSHDYGRLAQWRTNDPAERAKALHVDKPPPVLAGQLDMWEGALT